MSSKDQLKVITLDQVKKHNTEDDLWMVINGIVYDFTEYLDEHPGGDVMLDGAGRDGSELYSSIGHSSEADEQLKEYVIGKLETTT